MAGESSARAEGPVTPDGKGIVGGALLGAEVVDITMAIIGVEKGWPYFVFGGVGAVGGGIGGYFVEQEVTTAEPALYMLAGGMALVIPTLVLSLNATAYKPPESDQKTTEPVTNQPAAEPPAPGGVQKSVNITSDARPAPRKARPFRTSPAYVNVTPHVPGSVVDVYRGRLALAMPAPEVRTVYTRREAVVYGVEQGKEFRLPVLKAQF
jgi:hypothetical protein